VEKRDLIKDELERMGKAISQFLTIFLGLKDDGNIEQAIATTNKQLKTELDIDVELMLTFQQQELVEYLKNKNITPKHVESLVNYFAETGYALTGLDATKTSILLEKALELIDFIDNETKTYCFERKTQEQKIRAFITTIS
jgi:ABC-type phosphate/phosphonate transport system substrate-binding protein